MNDSNLIPLNKRTKSEQREICSKGGKASGVSRNLKSAVKKEVKNNPSLLDEIVQMLKDETLNKRNLKAAEILIDLMGESVQRETLALKKKELKLKESELKNKQEEQETNSTFADIITAAYKKRTNINKGDQNE